MRRFIICVFKHFESCLTLCGVTLSLFHALVNTGELYISLQQVTNLAPFAQVVIYTVMPSGEAVADSQDFPIQLCLNNKVVYEKKTRF